MTLGDFCPLSLGEIGWLMRPPDGLRFEGHPGVWFLGEQETYSREFVGVKGIWGPEGNRIG